MKRTLKISLGLVLGAAMAVPAMAQDQFPNVPANHWAYEALENLKAEGIVVGYPDGQYRGPRLATRYEMAVAINAAYKRMMSMTDGLAEQLKALEEMMGKGDNGDAMNSIKALRAQVDSMKGWGDDVATLKKLVEEFEKELTGLGNDVDMMKEKLGGLEGRVAALEAVKFPVSISGDANIVVFAGNSRDKRTGMNKEGRIVGANDQAGGAQTGLTRDLNVYHELAIDLKGTNTEGPKWNATLVYGNAMGANGILNDLVTGGADYRDNINGDMYIDSFAVNFDTSLVGVDFNAEVGRIKAKIAPYILMRADNTLYFANSRWDDGAYRVDGGKLTFNFGGVDLAIMGGRFSNRNSNNGVALNGTTGFGTPDNLLGAVIGFNVGTLGRVNAAYVYHDFNGAIAAAFPNRLNVMGVDGSFKVGGFDVNAGYSKSIMTHNTKNLGMDRLNQAAFANATYNQENWGAMAEYRKIQRDFAAQGSWRRIGTNWNPTNIATFYGTVWFAPTQAMKLHAAGEFGNTIEALGGIAKDTKIESLNVGLDYKVNDAWTAMLGYEEAKVKITGNNIRQRWASIGLGYNLGTNALLNFAYEYGSVNNPFAWGMGGAGTYRGGFLTSQLTLRF